MTESYWPPAPPGVVNGPSPGTGRSTGPQGYWVYSDGKIKWVNADGTVSTNVAIYPEYPGYDEVREMAGHIDDSGLFNAMFGDEWYVFWRKAALVAGGFAIGYYAGYAIAGVSAKAIQAIAGISGKLLGAGISLGLGAIAYQTVMWSFSPDVEGDGFFQQWWNAGPDTLTPEGKAFWYGALGGFALGGASYVYDQIPTAAELATSAGKYLLNYDEIRAATRLAESSDWRMWKWLLNVNEISNAGSLAPTVGQTFFDIGVPMYGF